LFALPPTHFFTLGFFETTHAIIQHKKLWRPPQIAILPRLAAGAKQHFPVTTSAWIINNEAFNRSSSVIILGGGLLYVALSHFGMPETIASICGSPAG
jgi:hypothetical protein